MMLTWVVSGKIEEIEIPEKVDMIILEPMGYIAAQREDAGDHLHAKKTPFKPGGKMFPLPLDPSGSVTDEALYNGAIQQGELTWYQEYFHGVNHSVLRGEALKEYFRQPC